MILVFRASTNCPTVGLLFEPQCKWIKPNVFSRLIQTTGVKTVKTCTFQHSPHMLDSTNTYNPPIMWCSRFLEGRFTILKEDPTLYPHTCLGPVTYMGTVVTKWAMQCLARCARFTLLKLSNRLLTSSTTHSIGMYSLLNTPTKHTHTHEQFHTCFIVTVGQFEKYT